MKYLNTNKKKAWAKLVQAVPQLADLLDEVSKDDGADSFCGYKVWGGKWEYTGLPLPKGGSFARIAERTPKVLDFKCVEEGIYDKMSKLFGLHTAEHDIAEELLMSALPPCRNCSCHHQRWRKCASAA